MRSHGCYLEWVPVNSYLVWVVWLIRFFFAVSIVSICKPAIVDEQTRNPTRDNEIEEARHPGMKVISGLGLSRKLDLKVTHWTKITPRRQREQKMTGWLGGFLTEKTLSRFKRTNMWFELFITRLYLYRCVLVPQNFKSSTTTYLVKSLQFIFRHYIPEVIQLSNNKGELVKVPFKAWRIS